MLDPAKALLFRRGHKFAIDKQTSRRITVISVKTQDFHGQRSAITDHKSVDSKATTVQTTIVFQ
jgi:hypothetical protein